MKCTYREVTQGLGVWERFRVGVMVRTPEANLSRAIQWLNISYSVWFNKRHQECGHVFQGRFKSVVVEDEAWGLELSQYVHLNPVRIKALGQETPPDPSALLLRLPALAD